MKTSTYKLEEYKIIEYDTGELSWEAHFGFGSLQEGRCFKKGAILFIGPAENERLGYLKLEYIDHLKRLPDWQKTDYYCTSLEVYHCDTGKSVSKEEMNLWKYDQHLYGKEKVFLDHDSVNLNNISTLKSPGDVVYRLHRHEIIIKKNGQIIWNSYSGPITGGSGTCNIIEDILFIGPRLNIHKSFLKRQFLNDLNQLPKWEQTTYFCPKFVLRECKTSSRKHEEKKIWLRNKLVRERNGVEGEDKKSTELKISHDMTQQVFSERISTVFRSLFKSKTVRGNSKRFFQSNQQGISKNNVMFGASSIKTLIIGAAGLVLMITLLIVLFLSSHLKGYSGHWNNNNKAHPSSHRMNR